ncbi:MAG: hypothetical protein IPP06_06285 [Saprospiraceae bacterium]|nr:hypothetical protein [Candidatus Vicinibacter affinis]
MSNRCNNRLSYIADACKHRRPATATDVCDASPVITFTDGVSTPGACPGTYSFVRTWKATDACNNMSTCPQSITVRI